MEDDQSVARFNAAAMRGIQHNFTSMRGSVSIFVDFHSIIFFNNRHAEEIKRAQIWFKIRCVKQTVDMNAVVFESFGCNLSGSSNRCKRIFTKLKTVKLQSFI